MSDWDLPYEYAILAAEACIQPEDEAYADAKAWLAAHDREVAARVLRELHGELAAWEGYDTRDIGWAFLAASVLEHIDEKRAELERGEDV